MGARPHERSTQALNERLGPCPGRPGVGPARAAGAAVMICEAARLIASASPASACANMAFIRISTCLSSEGAGADEPPVLGA